MVQKKGHVTVLKHHLLGLITVAGIVSALWCQSFVSLADSTGTVAVESAKIREKADTGSEVIGSAAYGNTVTIKGEAQDSSGTLWYEVNVDGGRTGYIRSDLLNKQGGDSDTEVLQTASNEGGQDAQQPPGASVDPGTFMDAQYADITAEAAKVRAAPSTNDAVVDTLSRDTQVIVGGQSDGSDGKVWYYVIFIGTDGAEKSGYIRSDLLSLGDMVPVPEEEAPEPVEETSEPTEPVNNDYELTYEPNADGSYAWYLYDYTGEANQSDKYSLDQLMEATRVRSENDAADAKTLVRQRIVIVVLIVLVILLIVAVIIMALKLRDAYYEDYEDEEEEEEEEEESSTQRRRRTEEDEAPTQRRRRAGEEEEPSQRSRRRKEEDEAPTQRRRRTEEDNSTRRKRRMEEEEEAENVSAKTAAKRKAKNFLLDDDEFEFEFLNMDDKDL